MNKKLLLTIIFSIGILPFLLNGFYNHAISNNPLIYWIVEIITWIIIPIILLTISIKKNLFTLNDIGLKLTLNLKIKRELNILLFLLLIIIVPVILYYGYTSARELSFKLFPINYGVIEFNYYSVIPRFGIKQLIAVIFFSITAGFVEEIYFRGLFWKITENIKYNAIIYILISSIIFSTVHWEGGIQNLFATFVFGLICSSFYIKFKNLWPLIFGHFIVDFILFIR